MTRCENRAVSARSPTDRAQIFSVSTSHLQRKYSFRAFVRSANLGKLRCTSKERSDELTWQRAFLAINLLRIWSIRFPSPWSMLGVSLLGVSSGAWCVFQLKSLSDAYLFCKGKSPLHRTDKVNSAAWGNGSGTAFRGSDLYINYKVCQFRTPI